MNSNKLESLRRGNSSKPFQSKLVPHLELIRALRASRTPYSQIAAEIEARFGLRIAASTIHAFVKARSRRRDVFTIFEPLKEQITPAAAADVGVDAIEQFKRRAQKIGECTSDEWRFYDPNKPLEKISHQK